MQVKRMLAYKSHGLLAHISVCLLGFHLSTLSTSFLPASTFTLIFNLSKDHLSLFTRWLSQFF